MNPTFTAPGTGQIASIWLNDRLAWSAQLPTPAGEWSRGLIGLGRDAGGFARVATAISRNVTGQTGEFRVRNARVVPQTALASLYCFPDFNADGFLTFEDFDAFVSAFEAGSASADFNADGFLTFEDFDAFVAAFEAGC